MTFHSNQNLNWVVLSHWDGCSKQGMIGRKKDFSFLEVFDSKSSVVWLLVTLRYFAWYGDFTCTTWGWAALGKGDTTGGKVFRISLYCHQAHLGQTSCPWMWCAGWWSHGTHRSAWLGEGKCPRLIHGHGHEETRVRETFHQKYQSRLKRSQQVSLQAVLRVSLASSRLPNGHHIWIH